MKPRRSVFRAALFVAALSSPGVALAEADSAGAEALFREGKRLMDEGRVAEACPKLAESYRLDPATGALLATALCYERLGKVASAWAAYTEVAARSKNEGRADREESARSKAAELEARLSKLVVELEPGAHVAGLTVTRDGVPLGDGVFGVALPVDPGVHEVEARAPGRRPYVARVQSKESETDRVRIPALPVEPATSSADSATGSGTESIMADTTSEPGFFTPLRTVGLVVAGAGVAGVAVGSFFGARALSLNGDSDETCEGDVCEDPGFGLREDARRAGNLSTVFFAAGLGLVVGGATLFLLGAPEEGKTTAYVLPLPGGGAAGFRTGF